LEAGIFAHLPPAARNFWLRLSEGLDSFSYSSRTLNPLFRLLGWGSPVLNLVASAEKERDLPGDSILETYSFFKTTLSSRANAYLLRILIDSENLDLLKSSRFRERFEEFSYRLSKQLPPQVLSSSSAPYVHLLPLDTGFLDFFRLSGHIVRASEEEATMLKKLVDQELAEFRKGITVWLFEMDGLFL
jgi:hypothetical protein